MLPLPTLLLLPSAPGAGRERGLRLPMTPTGRLGDGGAAASPPIPAALKPLPLVGSASTRSGARPGAGPGIEIGAEAGAGAEAEAEAEAAVEVGAVAAAALL